MGTPCSIGDVGPGEVPAQPDHLPAARAQTHSEFTGSGRTVVGVKHSRSLLALVGVVSLAVTSACSGDSTETATDSSATGDTVESSTAASDESASDENAADHDDPADYEWDASSAVEISLDGDTATASSEAVSIDGSTVTISAAGTYILSGSLADGQVVVETDDEELVRLVLDGADITSSTTAPIAIADADKAVVVLADGSDNLLTDSSNYAFPDAETDEPNAALFSAADLTVTGEGSLTVEANFNDGIASKDGLIIDSGTIVVDAVDDGIRGKDYLVVKDGSITVDAGGDGLKSDNTEDASMGYVSVAGGTVDITSGGDGIDAETDVLTSGGEIAITSGGGSTGQLAEDASAKAIKGVVSVVIDAGTFALDAADDAVHSNSAVTINGGSFTIATGDDGVHADETLDVNDGTIDITSSFEGLESAVMTINGGDISIQSSDDGLNVAGGTDGSGQQGPPGGPGEGRPAADTFGATGDHSMTINGGTIVVVADGDGLDANGSVTMTGGTVVIHGPTSDFNGALDYDGSFTLTGGILVAAGSAGMAQSPTSSDQPVIGLRFDDVQPAGTLVHVQDADGTGVLTFEPAKDFQTVVFSSPGLTSGATYDVYLEGSASGEAAGGLLDPGTYTPGTKAGSITASG